MDHDIAPSIRKLQLSFTAANVNDFAYDILHRRFGRFHVMTRIVSVRIFLEIVLQGIGESDFQFGGDVDLAHAQRNCPTDVAIGQA